MASTWGSERERKVDCLVLYTILAIVPLDRSFPPQLCHTFYLDSRIVDSIIYKRGLVSNHMFTLHYSKTRINRIQFETAYV